MQKLGIMPIQVYNSYRSGGIIKYQNSGKLVGRYSDSNNIQLTSEMPVRAYVNNNGQLDYTRQYNPSAGYVSGTDPLGEFVVGNAVLNKLICLAI